MWGIFLFVGAKIKKKCGFSRNTFIIRNKVVSIVRDNEKSKGLKMGYFPWK